MSDISQWSTTASSNTATPPDGFPEGQAPSTLNDGIRECMAATAKWFKDSGGNGEIVSGGAANIQTLTTTQTHAALDDMPFTLFRAGYTNTGSTTLNVDSLGAKSINLNSIALVGGEIVAGEIYGVVRNATNDVYDLVTIPSGYSTLKVNTISELTSANGVSIDSVTLKDGDVSLSTTNFLQFRDSAIKILSSTDGQLDIDADGELEITAPTVDIDASTAVLISNDLKLDSDSAVLGFGADNDCTLTHTDGTGLTLNSTNKITFGDVATFIQQGSDGVMRIDGEATIDLNASTAVTVSNDLRLDSDSAVLGFGGDNDTTLTHTDGSGLTLNSTNKIMFNDASQFIHAPSNAILDIAATDEVELTATLVDAVGNFAVSGTSAFTGAITSNAGVVVDNITIDGTEIDLSSGDLTLDVAGDIVLDAAGEEIVFADATTSVGHISMASSNLTIKSLVSDKDLFIQGNDGGSPVTAMSFDMSAAGAATLNSGLTLTAGNLVLANAAGIDFSATADSSGTATSELLDDYEEGTWTPTDASGGGLSLTVVAAACVYTKIGRLVHANLSVTYPTTSDGNRASIGGLPFTSINASVANFGAIFAYTTYSDTWTTIVNTNATDTEFYKAGGADLTNANLTAKAIRMCIIYMTG